MIGSSRPLQLTLTKSSKSQAIGLTATLFIWLTGAGLSLRTSITAILVVTAVCVWGLISVKIICPERILPEQLVLWLAGPCFGFGAFSLLVLRMFVSKDLFLLSFAAIPAVYIVSHCINTHRQSDDSRVSKDWSLEAPLFLYAMIGLTGVNLGSHWIWSTPVALLALTTAITMSALRVSKQILVWLAGIPIIALLSSIALARPDTWWLDADWIPTDEALLESYSNALVSFGPTTNPLWHGLSASSALSYHHLAYLIIGIINAFSDAAPYEVLVVAAPPIMSLSLVASLLLFFRNIVERHEADFRLAGLAVVGIVACLQVVGIGNHPSLMLGYGSLLASFIVIGAADETSSTNRDAALVAVSILVVAFSKGPFIIGSLSIASALALLSFKLYWKTALSAVVTSALISIFFASASDAASPLRVEFWSDSHMTSRFELSLYNLRMFLGLLIIPVAVGLACSIVSLFSADSVSRKLAILLTSVILTGIMSQIVLASDSTSGHTYFFRPAMLASGLSIVVLTQLAESRRRSDRRFIGLGVLFMFVSILLPYRVPERFETAIITTSSVAAAIAILLTGSRKLADALHKHGATRSFERISISVAVMLAGVVIFENSKSYPERLSRLTATYSDFSVDNWYGSREMIELTNYLKKETKSLDLIALSNCDVALFAGDGCEPDPRIAAISGRRFLAVDPVFREDYVDEVTWSDVVLSSTIGKKSPRETIQRFLSRGVTYLILEKSRVPKNWRDTASRLAVTNVFENNSYLVLKLSRT